MAKTGRPKKGEGEQDTVQIRCYPEMKAMIDELLPVMGMSTAQLLQHIAGLRLQELHDRSKPLIAKAKGTQEKAAQELAKVQKEAMAMLGGDMAPTVANRQRKD